MDNSIILKDDELFTNIFLILFELIIFFTYLLFLF